MNYQFQDEEIPYETLEQFGLTREMIEDLPIDILQQIYDGRPTPVLPVHVTLENGDEVSSRTRFSLVRRQDGTADVLFYPVLDEVQFKNLDEQQQQKLLANKVIIDYKNKEAAEQGIKSFLQLDTETKQVLSVPTPVIGRNLQMIADNHHLIAAELQSLQNGEVLTILSNKQQISLGIDLNSKSRIRFAAGDESQWRRESKREWDKYTFGAFGCWIMDDNGNLNYVSDEDYTEELWNEQKKHGMRMHQR